MKHVTYAQRSLLTGGAVANLLLEYAALLVKAGDADTVSIAAVDSDGNDVTATLLLETGAPLIAETTDTAISEPDNSVVEQYMREQISARRTPPSAVVPDPAALDDWPVDYDLTD